MTDFVALRTRLAALTANLDEPRGIVVLETERDVAHGAQIRRDDLANGSVASRRPGGVEVRVSDRGPGVPPEHREQIFEKFHRVDDTLTAEKSGAGLGLSIARQLARGLGGELRYRPRAGAGAEFILELP